LPQPLRARLIIASGLKTSRRPWYVHNAEVCTAGDKHAYTQLIRLLLSTVSVQVMTQKVTVRCVRFGR